MTTITAIPQIITETIRGCIAETTGFYMKIDGRSVRVDHIQNGSNNTSYLPYGIY